MAEAFEELADRSCEATFIADTQGRIHYLSPAAYLRFLPRAARRAEQLTLSDLLHPDSAEGIVAMPPAPGRGRDRDVQVHSHGSGWVCANLRLSRSEDGRWILGALFTPGAEHARNADWDENAATQAFADNPVGTAVLARNAADEWVVLEANDAMLDMVSAPFTSVVGASPAWAVHPDDWSTLSSDVLSRDSNQGTVVRMRSQGGQWRWRAVRSTEENSRGAAGSIHVVHIVDVDDAMRQHQIDRALRRAYRESLALGPLTAEMCPAQVLGQLFERVGALLGVQRVSLVRARPQPGEWWIAHEWHAEGLLPRLPDRERFTYPQERWTAPLEGHAVSDLPTTEVITAEVRDELLADGTFAFLYEPLAARPDGAGQEGWLMIERTWAGPWSALECRTAQLVAELSATVVQRAMHDEAVRAARAEAEQANAAKTLFVSRLAHEAGTPLNAIMTYTTLLADQCDGEARADLESLQVGAKHLQKLMNDVLDLSRIESGNLPLDLTRVSVSVVADEVTRLVDPLARERDIRIQVAGDPGVFVAADADRLRQVLTNLLNNAVKYNKPQGRVMLRWAAVGNSVSITVEDTGTGIPPNLREEIWQPFSRPDSVRSIEGAGIGLSLVKGLVTIMNGSVELSSDVGLGSTFRVVLPEGSAAPAQTPSAAAPPVAPQEELLKVLVIEDHPTNQRIIRRVVELDEKRRWTVLEAKTGPDGVAAALEHRPHLILLDLHLPGYDGTQVMAALKGDPRTSAIPVVINTADAAGGHAIAPQARAFLPKPLDVPKLRGILDEVAQEIRAA